MKRMFLIVTILLAGATTMAQQEKAPAKSDVEALTFENLRLQAALTQTLKEKGTCLAQLAPLQAQVNGDGVQKQATDLVALVEKNHPGYTLDLQTGDLVKKPVKQ